MRSLLHAAALAVSCALLGACIPSQKLRESTAPEHGAIVMAVEFKGTAFPYWRRHRASELFFARIQPDGGLEPVLVPANYRSGDRLYALDLPPGRYALVAASYFTGRTRQLARFQGDKAKKWVVEVKPGAITFGGALWLPRPFPGWDVFFVDGLRRAASYLPPFKRALISVTLGTARTDLSPATELQALRLARVDLKDTAWGEAADVKLRAFGNPPPMLTQGTFRKRPVPRLRADTFSWIDTLHWGKPQAVDGGLEWRRPKARAWISVTFVPSEGTGARPLQAELKALREAGAPEDSHTLSEVAVSSRAALSASYTTYLYPEALLVGSDVRVLRTEAVVVPVTDGFYKLVYRAASDEFDRSRPDFQTFVRYLDLAKPPALLEKT